LKEGPRSKAAILQVQLGENLITLLLDLVSKNNNSYYLYGDMHVGKGIQLACGMECFNNYKLLVVSWYGSPQN
jgi:hypothetical protein